MEFNETKFKECDDDHDWGYNENAGNCLYCGLIHDCDLDDRYEFDGDNFICAICHIYPTHQVLKEIEQARIDVTLLDQDFRRATGF